MIKVKIGTLVKFCQRRGCRCRDCNWFSECNRLKDKYNVFAQELLKKSKMYDEIKDCEV